LAKVVIGIGLAAKMVGYSTADQRRYKVPDSLSRKFMSLLRKALGSWPTHSRIPALVTDRVSFHGLASTPNCRAREFYHGIAFTAAAHAGAG
jgi:hypothetical protein